MGALISKVFSPLFGARQVKIITIGLDAGGKTTFLYKLKLGEVTTTIPTIGFNLESVQYKNIQIISWDVGGRMKIRPLYRHFYSGAHGIIFVIDSADTCRIDDAAIELQKNLNEDELKGIPVLVLANKQDLPSAMSVSEITDKLGLHALRNRQWYIQATSATSGDGIYEGIDWLSMAMKQRIEMVDLVENKTIESEKGKVQIKDQVENKTIESEKGKVQTKDQVENKTVESEESWTIGKKGAEIFNTIWNSLPVAF